MIICKSIQINIKYQYSIYTIMTIISGSAKISTAMGDKWSINADFTATGSIYPPIENAMDNMVYPYYANTHSNAHNGQLMSHYISQSKETIRSSVGAKQCDRIIMTGNGCTGAITHLIHLLNLKVETKPITVVIISVAEHHSNYLPWKHLPVELIVVPLLDSGIIDSKHLFSKIKYYRDKGHPVICSLIAGSNVTGVIQPFYAISREIHKNKALVFWDFAGCAPYVQIKMHIDELTYFDAVMISPHKMLGGPGSPGLLIANNKLFRNDVPYCPGGGTVRFVNSDFTHYSHNLEQRETGGTPNIIGSIKMGLAFQLKDRIQAKISKREHEINKLVRSWMKEQRKGNFHMLNPADHWKTPQVPIYSFVIPGLHYNFIVALLNDFYGIQSRGGVSCCSLYAQYILDVSKKSQNQIYEQIIHDKGVPKDYGWCRVSFHYTMTDDIVLYILKALDSVALYGKTWLDKYVYEPKENRWHYRNYTHKFAKLRLDYRDICEPDIAKLDSKLLDQQYTQGYQQIKKH